MADNQAVPLRDVVTIAELEQIGQALTGSGAGHNDPYQEAVSLLLFRAYCVADAPLGEVVGVQDLLASARDLELVQGTEWARGVIDVLVEAMGLEGDPGRAQVADLVFARPRR